MKPKLSWPIKLISVGLLVLSVLALWSARAPELPVVHAQSGNVEIVEGWTGPLDFRLLADGSALDISGMTVELLLTAQDGTAIDTTGDTSITDATDGEVRYLPDPTDLDSDDSPILMRWKVTDDLGRVVYHPSGRPAVIAVRPVF
jgi:hypothetical protein